MKNFKIKDKVKNTFTNDCGTVIYCYDTSDDVAVEWINGYIQKINSNELIHYSNELEQGFAELQTKVNNAAALMADINQIAHNFQVHLKALQDNNHINTNDLFNELVRTGWVSSNSDC